MVDNSESDVASRVTRLTDEALHTVYELYSPTPLECFSPNGCRVWLKREDLSPVHSYKWRGAFNAMSSLPFATLKRGVVAASAGNHAQGVAVAARKLGCQAVIYMPDVTPAVKRRAVAELGGSHVRIVIAGKSYDEASQAAKDEALRLGAAYIHPFDDPAVLAGNGTIGREIVTDLARSGEVPDAAYLQIGGGGMAASVALALRRAFPAIHLVGVEGEEQACMRASLSAGKLVTLERVDAFCDGTAVKQPGALAFELCRDLLDDLVTVSNREVCEAMQNLWEGRRILCEPSGALGFAGLWKERRQLHGQGAVVVLSGSNVDLSQVATISWKKSDAAFLNLA